VSIIGGKFKMKDQIKKVLPIIAGIILICFTILFLTGHIINKPSITKDIDNNQVSSHTPGNQNIDATKQSAERIEIKEKKISFTERLSKDGPDLRFEMYGKFRNGVLKQGHIDVFDVSGAKRIQKIIINDNYEESHFDWDIDSFEYNGHEVQMVDLNFDGYLDLRILDNEGATGNNWYASYIYDRFSGKFKFNKRLSELSGVRIDASNKQIITYSREGACSECIEYYKVISDRLFLVKIEWAEIDRRRDDEVGGFGCFKYTGKPRVNNLKFDAFRFIYDDRYRSYIRKKIKDIREEPLYGSLDGRRRGPLGNPY
jgi:hypothetical protein